MLSLVNTLSLIIFELCAREKMAQVAIYPLCSPLMSRSGAKPFSEKRGKRIYKRTNAMLANTQPERT
jgi:hypothetical protein